MKKDNVKEYKENNKSSFNYINRAKTIGIIGVVYGIGVTIFDVVRRSPSYNYYLDGAVIAVSIFFVIMSHFTLKKMVMKYNLKKYKENKKKSKK